MTARYGERTRIGDPVTDWGRNPDIVDKIRLSANPAPSATVSTYAGYIVFKFTSTGTLEVGPGTPIAGGHVADVFVVAGGSGGSNNPSSGNVDGAVGGAGGARRESPGTAIVGATPIPVVVGGASSDSTFGPISSSGGLAGGAGGALAGFPTANPGSAGPTNTYETGIAQNYGGGGGSGGIAAPPSLPVNPGGAGGAGGGGAGGSGGRTTPSAGQSGSNGTANTGGGGGGGGAPGPSYGGAGGSGVVIVRFPSFFFGT